jgi:hypothetical protein
MRRIARAFAQARFGSLIQRETSIASFRSTTRIESFDCANRDATRGRKRPNDSLLFGAWARVVLACVAVDGQPFTDNILAGL